MSDTTPPSSSSSSSSSSSFGSASPETHVIDYRAAEQLLAARDPRGAVKLLDSVIAAHPENTAARLLRARAFFASAQLRPAELEFELVLEREPDNAFAHFALANGFVTLAGAAARHVLDGSRQTIVGSVETDPRGAGWRRVTGGNACSYCTSLAGAPTGVEFASHDHCGCVAEPAF